MDAEQRARLERWLDELDSWSRRMSLTSVPRDAAWARHVEDSLPLLDAAADVPEAAEVVDLGSGGGVPGVVLAVLRPGWRVTLLDADRRRGGFLLHTAGLLGLGNVAVVVERAEEHGRGGGRERYDLCVSRATAPAAALCELALPLLRTGGTLLALVADAAADAGVCAAAAAEAGGGTPEAVSPGVLRVGKVAATPEGLPRRPGVAQARRR